MPNMFIACRSSHQRAGDPGMAVSGRPDGAARQESLVSRLPSGCSPTLCAAGRGGGALHCILFCTHVSVSLLVLLSVQAISSTQSRYIHTQGIQGLKTLHLLSVPHTEYGPSDAKGFSWLSWHKPFKAHRFHRSPDQDVNDTHVPIAVCASVASISVDS